ncbi:hypothetical protein [Rhodococcus sp. SJ-2]
MTPPRDLADAQNRLDRVRDYALEQHRCAEYLRSLGTEAGRYHALPYENSARTLERIIGGEQ